MIQSRLGQRGIIAFGTQCPGHKRPRGAQGPSARPGVLSLSERGLHGRRWHAPVEGARQEARRSLIGYDEATGLNRAAEANLLRRLSREGIPIHIDGRDRRCWLIDRREVSKLIKPEKVESMQHSETAAQTRRRLTPLCNKA